MTPPLPPLAVLRNVVDQQEESLRTSRAILYNAVRRHLAAGRSPTVIAREVGWSRRQIYHVRDAGRGRPKDRP